MKRDFIIISIILLFLANVSVMYYRNYEGFTTKEDRAEAAKEAREAREAAKEAKKLDKELKDEKKALEKAKNDLDKVENNTAVQKYVGLNKEVINKTCAIEKKKVESGLDKYQDTEVPEICESTDVSSSLGSTSLGSFSGTL